MGEEKMNISGKGRFELMSRSALFIMLLCWPILGSAAIQVASATYGANCGAETDNVKIPLADACDGRVNCEYIIDYQVLGDPAPGCAKNFTVGWTCRTGGSLRNATVPAEAGFQSRVALSCGIAHPGAVVQPAPPGHPGAEAVPPPVVLHPAGKPDTPAPITAEKNYTLMPVYFATDREPTGSTDPDERFGTDRGDMSYGTCVVSIPNDHQMGALESPSLWQLEFRPDPEKHIVLVSVSPMPKDQLFQELAEEIAKTGSKSAFVFVHGYNVTFEDAARRTAQMAYDLNFDGAPIFYSWPSQARVLEYTRDEQEVEWTQAHLQHFLQDVVARSEAQNIYLVAHSMGNRALTRAFAQLVADKPELAARVTELILTAPDIDADVFKTQIAPKLVQLGTPVTLYASSEDEALNVSKEVHGAPRAGDAGDGIVILAGMETIDASLVDSSLVGHSYYAENKSVIADIFYVFKERKRARDRFGLREIVTPQGRYWEFKQ
jgi:esterase/lipase superfamily enzyme